MHQWYKLSSLLLRTVLEILSWKINKNERKAFILEKKLVKLSFFADDMDMYRCVSVKEFNKWLEWKRSIQKLFYTFLNTKNKLSKNEISHSIYKKH